MLILQSIGLKKRKNLAMMSLGFKKKNELITTIRKLKSKLEVTNSVNTNFVNTQTSNFLKKVSNLSPDDFYLKKAKNFYSSYSKLYEINQITVNLASPDRIRYWAEKILPNHKILGRVTNANTLHYKSFKPQKGGLFCERIFGPLRDFECACGKTQKKFEQILEVKNNQTSLPISEKIEIANQSITATEKRKFCPDCDVEYTWSVIRRYQLGYIQLIAPVTHLWYLKGSPSYLSLLLNMKKKDLEAIIYCSETMTLEASWNNKPVISASPSNLIKSWKEMPQPNSKKIVLLEKTVLLEKQKLNEARKKILPQRLTNWRKFEKLALNLEANNSLNENKTFFMKTSDLQNLDKKIFNETTFTRLTDSKTLPTTLYIREKLTYLANKKFKVLFLNHIWAKFCQKSSLLAYKKTNQLMKKTLVPSLIHSNREEMESDIPKFSLSSMNLKGFSKAKKEEELSKLKSKKLTQFTKEALLRKAPRTVNRIREKINDFLSLKPTLESLKLYERKKYQKQLIIFRQFSFNNPSFYLLFLRKMSFLEKIKKKKLIQLIKIKKSLKKQKLKTDETLLKKTKFHSYLLSTNSSFWLLLKQIKLNFKNSLLKSILKMPLGKLKPFFDPNFISDSAIKFKDLRNKKVFSSNLTTNKKALLQSNLLSKKILANSNFLIQLLSNELTKKLIKLQLTSTLKKNLKNSFTVLEKKAVESLDLNTLFLVNNLNFPKVSQIEKTKFLFLKKKTQLKLKFFYLKIKHLKQNQLVSQKVFLKLNENKVTSKSKFKKTLEEKSLFNNIYTLSHCFNWKKTKDWYSFFIYMSASKTCQDSEIFYYQKRISNTETPSLVGAGIVQKLLTEFHVSELKIMDKQNRLQLAELTKEMNQLKKFVRLGLADKADDLRYKELFQEKNHLIRRLKLTRIFYQKNSNAESMILSTLPVLPPDLRPIIKIDNQIAASDLNRFYQRILYRNERLKKFLKDSSTRYSTEMKFSQRLLQESVDNLISNGKGKVAAEKDSRGRPLKSLSDILKGKEGRFRQHLLGKRVDYSGRSVIVVGPKLKIHQCGLPKEMALELFLPFLIKRLIHSKMARTVIGAKTILQTNPTLTLEILNEVMENHPILLNRAPTLHRLGIQAFQAKCIEGRAILLHPLVCPAFNADFDGDQMAVHVPITVEARAEAWKLMFSRVNLLSAATGDPIVLPSQDMVLGCYYLTTESFNYKQSANKYFNNISQVMRAYYQEEFPKRLHLHSLIWIKYPFFSYSEHKRLLEHKPETMKETLENEYSPEEPFEIRIESQGTWTEISKKVQQRFDKNNTLISRYVCTTVGRIIFNLIIQATKHKNY